MPKAQMGTKANTFLEVEKVDESLTQWFLFSLLSRSLAHLLKARREVSYRAREEKG